MGEPVYDPWFAELNRRRATLFVHPVEPPGFNAEASRTNVSVVEFMFESTRALTTLVLSGKRQKFDAINIISTHAGGAIPFLAYRVSLAGAMPWAFKGGPQLSPDEILAGMASFHFDLTASTSPTALTALKDLVPADRLVMGFDFPLMPPETISPAVQSFTAFPDFNSEEKRKIARGNAERLLPRLQNTKP